MSLLINQLLSNAQLTILDTDTFRKALKHDLRLLPDSPSMNDTDQFFSNIVLPHKLYLHQGLYSHFLEFWERFFENIKKVDISRFQKMHKGFPYYFCGVAAYMAHDYERAVFYFDAALSEDAKNYPEFQKKDHSFQNKWTTAPAALFLTLNANNREQYAFELTKLTRKLLEKALKKYRQESREKMNISLLNKLFLSPSLLNPGGWRSAVTALFSYVLESDSRKKEFSLKSKHGGTQEPLFLHLFKGCLLFETLLKLSPHWKGKDEKKPLGFILKDPKIKTSLGINEKLSDEVRNKTFNDVIAKNVEWRNNNLSFYDRTVWTAYGIRNTTGHNLSWQTNMTTSDYINLSDDILFANILTILKLF